MPNARGRLRRWSKRILVGLLSLLGALVVLVAVALIALDTPPGRRLAGKVANSALHGAFAGDVRITELGGLTLRGVTGLDVAAWPELVRAWALSHAHG